MIGSGSRTPDRLTLTLARRVTYASGGHAFVGHEAELFAEVEAFIKQHQPT